MRFDAEHLYKLLPAVYRLRDARLAKEGEVPPLEALISILADELDNLEENLDQLYDDQFIETCSEWVVPYIGELIGNRPLIPIPDTKFSKRAEVANTIAYRRRKGTASIIEQLARDITGWDSNVVEFFELLSTTQYLNHLRPHNIAVASLRNWEQLEDVDSPFNQMARTADVRSIAKRRGKHNIPNIGVFLWRISSYFLNHVLAWRIEGTQKYTFHPLGVDMPLYSKAVAEPTITHLARPENVAQPITRRLLFEDRKAWLEQESHENYQPRYFALVKEQEDKIQIWVDDELLTPDQWQVCNLSGQLSDEWHNLPNESDMIFIDPELGRISLPDTMNPDTVQVSFNYGFGLPIGGGSYDRKVLDAEETSVKKLQVPGDHQKIQDAINDLGKTGGVILLKNNTTYEESLSIDLNKDASLIIRAGDGRRPVLIGSISITGKANSKVELNGLLLDGGIEVDATSECSELRLIHATVKPGTDANLIVIGSFFTKLIVDRSIVSGIRAVSGAEAQIFDSIIDVIDKEALAFSAPDDEPGAKIHIENSTVVGRVLCKQFEYVSNCIFTSKIQAAETQTGCMRFSFFPLDSKTPKAYKCQPSLTGKYVIKPVFLSDQYGQPDYLQLTNSTSSEILYGADNGSEMGVYFQQYTAQKIANLRLRLDEYLRFGLEAGIFLAS